MEPSEYGATRRRAIRYKRPTCYDIRRRIRLSLRRSRAWRDTPLLHVRSIPFKLEGAIPVSTAFHEVALALVWPEIEATSGTKHATRKQNLLEQILAQAKLADQRGCVLACHRSDDLRDQMFDALADHGYLRKALGSKRVGKTARYALTEKGRHTIIGFQSWRTILNPEKANPMLLRDANGRNRNLPNRPSSDIRQRLAAIKSLNAHNLREHRWQYVPKRESAIDLLPWVRAVYNVSFCRGGRLYSCTPVGFQQFTRKQRRRFLVDGERTVELDFAGFQPRLLYQLEGIDLRGDVYRPEQIFPNLYTASAAKQLFPLVLDEARAIARRLVKRATNIILNASNRQSAVRAVAAWISERSRRDRRICDRVLKVCGFQNPLRDGQIARFVDRIFALHQPIARHFFSDAGMKLQAGIETAILVEILLLFQHERIPALPIHDAVIVPRSARRKARQIMRKVYRGHVGFNPVIV